MNDEPRYSSELESLIAGFQRWLYLPDPTVLLVGMAAVVATRGEGKPPWVIVVGPASTGKTELIAPLEACSDVFSMTKASVAGLLTTRKGAGPGDGVLTRIAHSRRPGTILVRDLAALLFSHDVSANDVTNLLRDAYDGRIEREGGFGKASAVGKFGFVGAATNAIDRHHVVMGELGPRFLYCRTDTPGREAIAAVDRRLGQGDTWRQDLSSAVAAHLRERLPEPAPLDDDARKNLTTLVELVAAARVYVPRDHHGIVDGTADPEGPTRLYEVLLHLAGGLVGIGCSQPHAWRIVAKVALDSIPQDRRLVLHALAEQGTPLAAHHLAGLTPLPRSSAGRCAEDLTMAGLLTRSGGGDGPATWQLTPNARSWWQQNAPPPAVPGTWRDETMAASCLAGQADRNPEPGEAGGDWCAELDRMEDEDRRGWR